MTAQGKAVLAIGSISHADNLPKTTPAVRVTLWDSLSPHGIMQKPDAKRMVENDFKGWEFS